MSTILVVDDMAVFREPIAAALRQKGYQTVCAGDGLEALNAAREHPPDLVLLDLAMPAMDGLAVLKAMRADPTLQEIPVILLTAVAERDTVIKAARLGADAYLLKSQFSLDELLGRVRSCLEGDGGRHSPGRDTPDDAGEPDDADDDIDPETAGTFMDADYEPAPLEGLEEVSDEMSASQIIAQIENSAELSALTADTESGEGNAAG